MGQSRYRVVQVCRDRLLRQHCPKTEALHCNAVNCYYHTEQIEQYYSDIVGCLKLAERLCVPRYKVVFHKHWWSPKLDDMKQRYIDITNLGLQLVDQGVKSLIPNVFSVNKYRYKQAIKEAADD